MAIITPRAELLNIVILSTFSLGLGVTSTICKASMRRSVEDYNLGLNKQLLKCGIIKMVPHFLRGQGVEEMRAWISAFVLVGFVLYGVAPAVEAATAHGAVAKAAVVAAKCVSKSVAKTPGWSWKGVKWLVRHA